MEYCENTIDFSRWGLHFVGQNDVALRENKIRHHDRGIFIGLSGSGGDHRIGSQLGRGNTWSDQTLDPDECTEYSARVEDGSDPQKSLFLIHEANAMPFLPPNSKIYPISNPMWVDYDPSVSEDYCAPPGNTPPSLQLTPFEKELVSGTSVLTMTELWDLQRKVYLKLLLNSDLRPIGSAEESFFSSMAGTAIAAFCQVQQHVDNALLLSSTQQQNLDTARQAIFQSMDSLWLLDSVTLYPSVQNFSAAFYAQRSTLLQVIASSKGSEDTIKSTHNQHVASGLQTALTINSAISTNNSWEAARKTLNDIYVRHLLREPLTQNRYQQILDLAGEPVAIAGEAAQDAMLFLGPCDQYQFMTDESGEDERDISADPLPANIMGLQIIPNPTSGVVEVRLPDKFTGFVAILNISGQKVANAKVNTLGSPVFFDLRRHSPGLYWIVCSDLNGEIITSSKITLTR